jgi:hypothetical protein
VTTRPGRGMDAVSRSALRDRLLREFHDAPSSVDGPAAHGLLRLRAAVRRVTR